MVVSPYNNNNNNNSNNFVYTALFFPTQTLALIRPHPTISFFLRFPLWILRLALLQILGSTNRLTSMLLLPKEARRERPNLLAPAPPSVRFMYIV